MGGGGGVRGGVEHSDHISQGKPAEQRSAISQCNEYLTLVEFFRIFAGTFSREPWGIKRAHTLTQGILIFFFLSEGLRTESTS